MRHAPVELFFLFSEKPTTEMLLTKTKLHDESVPQVLAEWNDVYQDKYGFEISDRWVWDGFKYVVQLYSTANTPGRIVYPRLNMLWEMNPTKRDESLLHIYRKPRTKFTTAILVNKEHEFEREQYKKISAKTTVAHKLARLEHHIENWAEELDTRVIEKKLRT
jgi:hypothetical protein